MPWKPTTDMTREELVAHVEQLRAAVDRLAARNPRNQRGLVDLLASWEALSDEDALPDVDGDGQHSLIVADPDIRGGRPTIRGMRTTVSDILGWLASGMSDAEIIKHFPELTQDDICVALAYGKTNDARFRRALRRARGTVPDDIGIGGEDDADRD
ncbi:MAG: DUF433 domain-containing protein [Heliomarina sp.]|uniref:DUF433 domain-containing protein n=1 Tax=Heliomarina sp. TaxID=2917556 RepID=UPI004058890B